MLNKAVKACGQGFIHAFKNGLLYQSEHIDLSTSGGALTDLGNHPFSPLAIASTTTTRFRRQDSQALFQAVSRELFGMPHVAVSSGVGSANLCVYKALLQHNDCIIHMPVEGNDFSVPTEKTISNEIRVRLIGCPRRENGLVDYSELAKLAQLQKPRIIVASYGLYSRCLDVRRLKQISVHVGATLVVDISAVVGLILCGLLPSPSAYADVLTCSVSSSSIEDKGCWVFTKHEHQARLIENVMAALCPVAEKKSYRSWLKRLEFTKAPSFFEHQQQSQRNARAMCEVFITRGVSVVGGGTDTTFFLLDLRSLSITAQQAVLALAQTGIITRSDLGLRAADNDFDSNFLLLNSAAVTARGMSIESCRLLTEYICEVLCEPTALKALARSAKGIQELSSHYPALSNSQRFLAFQ